jgi:methylmalonyl-CoA mutase cobalamin-binding subunit
MMTLGVRGVFGPGTYTEAVVAFIRREMPAHGLVAGQA